MSKKKHLPKERFLVVRNNSYNTSDLTVGRLRSLADLIKNGLEGLHYQVSVVPETVLDVLAEIATYTENELLPYVECWCVVKRGPSSFHKGQVDMSVLTGHTTAAQARAYAKALDERERATFKKHPWWGPYREEFTAERNEIQVTRIINPKLSADEYVRGLG